MIRMAHVGAKRATVRRARAVGTLLMGRKAFALLKAGRLPKGDALALAQAAGIMAAKRTPELLPLCHPIALDGVSVDIELNSERPSARVYCTAEIEAKTGVEMEALTGAMGALLCLYDLIKPVDPALEITGVHLEYKEGGKKGLWRHPRAEKPTPAKAARRGSAAVITVSDRAHKKIYRDLSGPALAAGLESLGFTVRTRLLVPDDRARIEAAIRRAARGANAVVLTGGTGLSARDVTPEAVAAVCDRLIPGVGEALRAGGGPVTAALSRSVAGQLGRCVIVALPGSTGGVRDGLAVLADLLPHAVHVAAGGGHR